MDNKLYKNLIISENIYFENIFGDASKIKNIPVKSGCITSIRGINGIKTIGEKSNTITSFGKISLEDNIFIKGKSKNLNSEIYGNDIFINNKLEIGSFQSDSINILSNINLQNNQINNLGAPKDILDLVRISDVDDFCLQYIESKYNKFFSERDDVLMNLDNVYFFKNIGNPEYDNDAVNLKYFNETKSKIGKGLNINETKHISINLNKDNPLKLNEYGLYLDSNFKKYDIVYIPRFCGFSLKDREGLVCVIDGIVDNLRQAVIAYNQDGIWINIIDYKPILTGLFDQSISDIIITTKIGENGQKILLFDGYEIINDPILFLNKNYCFVNNSNDHFFININSNQLGINIKKK